MKKILFVCHGNICRSTMAEFVMKKIVKDASRETDFEIASAAVSTEEIGNPIYPPAKRCLALHDIPIDNSKTARQVTPEDYDYYDYLICMDTSNLRLMRSIIPTDPERKIRLLMSFAGSSRDVADPWYTRDFEATYDDVIKGCQALLKIF